MFLKYNNIETAGATLDEAIQMIRGAKAWTYFNGNRIDYSMTDDQIYLTVYGATKETYYDHMSALDELWSKIHDLSSENGLLKKTLSDHGIPFPESFGVKEGPKPGHR